MKCMQTCDTFIRLIKALIFVLYFDPTILNHSPFFVGLFQFIFAAVLAVAAAAPSDLSYEQDIIEILRQNIDHNDDHSYQQS